jgi:hypothetical protein
MPVIDVTTLLGNMITLYHSLEEELVTARLALDILNGEPPCVAYDDGGDGGVLVFPNTADGSRLARMLADQLNDAIDRDTILPGEDGPEPGCLAEPEGGEEARVRAEEAANAAHIAAAAQADDDLLWGRWRSGDRFVLAPADDLPRQMACANLWPAIVCNTPGAVVARLRVVVFSPFVEYFLLVDFEGRREPFAIRHNVLTACAKKVTS